MVRRVKWLSCCRVVLLMRADSQNPGMSGSVRPKGKGGVLRGSGQEACPLKDGTSDCMVYQLTNNHFVEPTLDRWRSGLRSGWRDDDGVELRLMRGI